MPIETPTTAPRLSLDGSGVTLRVADPDRHLRAVRLYQEIGLPGEQLGFTWADGVWSLTFPRPDVDRLEYLIEVTDRSGATHTVTDRANPLRVGGAFGDKSVLELPGYHPPRWLHPATPAPPGHRRALSVAARALHDEIEVELWSPPGIEDELPLPLLVVHDGPEYDRLAGLTTYLAELIGTRALRPLRAALLAPGHRNDRYSADGPYTRALCLALLPRLHAELATTVTIGMGASLGALAMLHAQRQQPTCFDALFLQSGSFFHPRLDAQERGFPRFARVTRAVDMILRSGGHPSPVPTVLTCGAHEENLANNAVMARALAAQGYDVMLREVRDMHNFTAWRDALDPWLTGLLRQMCMSVESR